MLSLFFTARRYVHPVYALAVSDVCLSVRVSPCPQWLNTIITQKRRTIVYLSRRARWCGTRCLSLLVFGCQKSWWKSTKVTLNGERTKPWVGKILRLSTNNSLCLANATKRQGKVSIKANRKSCALYRMVTLPMTLSDPHHSKSPLFCVLVFLLIFGSFKLCTHVGPSCDCKRNLGLD